MDDPSLNTIPVILLSARAGEHARGEGMEAGADDYVVKPFTAGELLARVGGRKAVDEGAANALTPKRRMKNASSRYRLLSNPFRPATAPMSP
jgi:DNA-binding response OmpR family regulator